MLTDKKPIGAGKFEYQKGRQVTLWTVVYSQRTWPERRSTRCGIAIGSQIAPNFTRSLFGLGFGWPFGVGWARSLAHPCKL